jgi:hypothetical protein
MWLQVSQHLSGVRKYVVLAISGRELGTRCSAQIRRLDHTVSEADEADGEGSASDADEGDGGASEQPGSEPEVVDENAVDAAESDDENEPAVDADANASAADAVAAGEDDELDAGSNESDAEAEGDDSGAD